MEKVSVHLKLAELDVDLTLLHLEWSKLYGVLTVLSAIGFRRKFDEFISSTKEGLICLQLVS